MGQSSCPGSENAHSGSILSIIAQSCLGRNTGNNCLHVHLQHTNHPYLHLLMLNISITVKHAKKKKNLTGLTQHCKLHLHTSVEKEGNPEETMLWLLLVFLLIVVSDLCSQIRSQVNYSAFHYVCTAGPQGWHPPHAHWKINLTAHGESDTRGCFGLGSHISQNNKK